jgi:ferredoxin
MIATHRLSVAGKYYVDKDSCICCAACADVITNHFRLDETVDYGAHVFKQPQTPEEEADCREAKMSCPVEAIHDDGNKRRISMNPPA